MKITDTEQRTLNVLFNSGSFIIEEVVKEEGEKPRTDTIWLTAEEIEKLNDFKMKMTGEKSL